MFFYDFFLPKQTVIGKLNKAYSIRSAALRYKILRSTPNFTQDDIRYYTSYKNKSCHNELVSTLCRRAVIKA